MKAIVIWLCIACFLGAIGVLGIMFTRAFPLPEPVIVEAASFIPPQVRDLRDRESVEPGTFRINVPFEEIFSGAKDGKYLLVTYNVGTPDASSRYTYVDEAPNLEYWLAYEASTWKYHRVVMPTIQERWFPNSWVLKWKGHFNPEAQSFRYVPERDYASALFFAAGASIFVALFILLLILMAIISDRSWRRSYPAW
ncbi:MAG: hypothetical protein HYT50_01630 [Candidatus Wildermuthbacteria bacterium]|nr:hypothetical protein [Candidatus Wildermuthbacteria bacterium]